MSVALLAEAPAVSGPAAAGVMPGGVVRPAGGPAAAGVMPGGVVRPAGGVRPGRPVSGPVGR